MADTSRVGASCAARLPQAMLRPPLTSLQRLPGLALQCPTGVFSNLKRVAVNPQRSEEDLTKEISLHQQVDMCTSAKTQHNSSSSRFSLGVISPATWAFFLALHYAQLSPPQGLCLAWQGVLWVCARLPTPHSGLNQSVTSAGALQHPLGLSFFCLLSSTFSVPEMTLCAH